MPSQPARHDQPPQVGRAAHGPSSRAGRHDRFGGQDATLTLAEQSVSAPSLSAEPGSRKVEVRDIWVYRRFVFLCALGAVVIALLYLALAGPTFVSSSSILLADDTSSGATGQGPRLDVATEAQVITSSPVLAAAGQQSGKSLESLMDTTTASTITNTRIVYLEAKGTSPEDAQRVNRSVVDAYRQQRLQAQQTVVDQYREYVAGQLARLRPNNGTRSDSTDAQRNQLLANLNIINNAGQSRTGGFSVVDPPSLPRTQTFYLTVSLSLLAALFAGVIIGVTLIVGSLNFGSKIRTRSHLGALTGTWVALIRVKGAGVDLNRAVDRLRRFMISRGARRATIASVAADEASSAVARRLASDFAGSGRTVLHITTLSPISGHATSNGESGLAAVASGAAIAECVVRSAESEDVWELRGAVRGRDATTVLSSSLLQASFARELHKWDIVLFSCAGLDAALTTGVSDEIVIVAEFGRTSEDALKEVVEANRSTGRVVGAIGVAERALRNEGSPRRRSREEVTS